MKHIEKAIREAVEKGGYSASTKKVGYHLEVDENATFLDPAFWQALGKARGWEQEDYEYCGGCGVRITKDTPDRKSGKHYACHSDIVWHRAEWDFQAKLFFSRLMEGKDAESFFAAL